MRTFVDARIRRILAFAPQKELRLNFFSTFFTGSEIQGLQVSLKAFIRFARRGQVGERGLEVRLARAEAVISTRKRVMGLLAVTSTQYPARAASSARRGEDPNGSSSQLPAGRRGREPGGNRPLFERGQEAGQQAGVGGASSLAGTAGHPLRKVYCPPRKRQGWVLLNDSASHHI